MAVYTLPLDSADGAYAVDVDLAGQVYRLGLTYNVRADLWALTISLPDGTALIEQQPLRVAVDVLAQFADERLPAGTLTLVDTSGTFAECGIADLGTRCLLVYDDGVT
jgi:hypothetical protein